MAWLTRNREGGVTFRCSEASAEPRATPFRASDSPGNGVAGLSRLGLGCGGSR